MTQAVNYEEWQAVTHDYLTKKELEDVDFLLEDGTVLSRWDWTGSYWNFAGVDVLPVYEDGLEGELQIVGFIYCPEVVA